MKKILLLLLFILPTVAFSQVKTKITEKSGVIYVGKFIKMQNDSVYLACGDGKILSFPNKDIFAVENIPDNIPIQSGEKDRQESSKIFPGAIMFLSGAAAIIVAAIDANDYSRISVGNQTITVPNEWTNYHTMITILGSGMVIGGVFVFDF